MYNPHNDPLALLSPEHVSELIERSKHALARDRRCKRGLPLVRVNHNIVRYRRKDVEAFIEANTVAVGE